MNENESLHYPDDDRENAPEGEKENFDQKASHLLRQPEPASPEQTEEFLETFNAAVTEFLDEKKQ